MPFKPILPRRGTVIPEHHRREPTSINSRLHALPAYREHVLDLRGVVLYLPRTRWVVVPTRLLGGSGDMSMGCVIVHGDERYPRGGYDVVVSEWELQRAQRVVLDIRSVQADFDPLPRIGMAQTADDHWIKVLVEPEVVVEPEPGAFDVAGEVKCTRCLAPIRRGGVPFGDGMRCPDEPECDRRAAQTEPHPGGAA